MTRLPPTYPSLLLFPVFLLIGYTGKAQKPAPDCYCYVASFNLINNNLFGVGVLSFLGDSATAVAGDFYLQTKSASNGLHDRPTYGSAGGDVNLGIRFLKFMVLAGPSLFTVAKPTGDQASPFEKKAELSWNAGLLYHYKSIGLGFTYSPLYGAGMKLSWWFHDEHGK